MSNKNKLIDLGIPVKKSFGNEKTICPKCSHLRKKKLDKCLSVDITEGIYHCFNCEWSGAIRKNTHENAQKPVYFQPKWENHTELPEKVVKWFNDRKISQSTLIAQKVTAGLAWMPQTGKDENCIKFNYFRDGQLVNIKYRDGRKNFRLEKGAELILYNLDAIGQDVVITEGEIDCLSYIESGITYAVSVPNGANKNLEYLDNCIDRFEKCERIYIATDQDEKGRLLRDELIRRLGEERCYIVDFKDCKDANEYLVKYGAIELAETIKTAKPCQISGIIYASQIANSVYDLYHNGMPPGDNIGISEFDKMLTFVPGYITTVVGIPSHGKSEWADEMMIRLSINHGWKWGVYSPENFPISYHISKWAEKLTGMSFRGNNQYQRMSELHVDKVLQFVEKHFFFISPETEDFSLQSILDHAKKLVRRNGIRGLIIDPWNRLEHQRPSGQSETEYIGQALDSIDNFSKKNNVHSILVVHPRKMEKNKEGKYEIPTLYDCAGSANFYNKSANGISVYRNFDDGSESTDIYVMKVKFKHWGEKGMVRMVYNRNNGRYTPFTAIEDTTNWLNQSEQTTLPTMKPNNDFLTLKTNEDADFPF